MSVNPTSLDIRLGVPMMQVESDRESSASDVSARPTYISLHSHPTTEYFPCICTTVCISAGPRRHCDHDSLHYSRPDMPFDILHQLFDPPSRSSGSANPSYPSAFEGFTPPLTASGLVPEFFAADLFPVCSYWISCPLAGLAKKAIEAAVPRSQ